VSKDYILLDFLPLPGRCIMNILVIEYMDNFSYIANTCCQALELLK